MPAGSKRYTSPPATPIARSDTTRRSRSVQRFGVEIMPRKSIGETPMTGAERQARYRPMRAAGAPVIRTRRPTDRRSRIQRWNDTIAAAVELQAEYAGWLDALPENQQ